MNPIKLIRKIVGRTLDYLFKFRVLIAPNSFLKSEQFLHEIGIEDMQERSGYKEFSAILRSHISKGATVLDIGCNKGYETAIIAKTNPVLGVDAYASFVKVARQRGVRAEIADFHKLSYSEEFDCVYSNNSLEHAKFPDKFVRGVYKALKPGGVFVIGMPLDGYNLAVKDPAHFFRAKEEDVVALLLQNNFEIIKKEVIDTKERWNWEILPAQNKVLICVARKKINV